MINKYHLYVSILIGFIVLGWFWPSIVPNTKPPEVLYTCDVFGYRSDNNIPYHKSEDVLKSEIMERNAIAGVQLVGSVVYFEHKDMYAAQSHSDIIEYPQIHCKRKQP